MLSDFKDKLIILDFWGTYCIPCVQHFPELYRLQKQFSKELFILPVDIDGKFDNPERVLDFFDKRRKAFSLPSALQDTVLRTMFNIQYMGRYVWIQNGILKQITDHEEVTSENITRLLNGDGVVLKQVVKVENNWQKKLFEDGNGTTMPITFYSRSLLFPYSPTLAGGGRDVDSEGKVTRIYQYNVSARTLLQIAYPQYNHFYNRIKVESISPEMILGDFRSDSGKIKSLYCYEANFPGVSQEQASEYVKQDLLRYFRYQLDSTRIVGAYYVLKLSDKYPVKIGSLNKTGTNIYDGIGLPIYFYNQPVSALRTALEDALKSPVLNETGSNVNLWLDLPPNLKNLSQLTESLERQGITLTREVRPVEFLVIKPIAAIN